MKITCLAVFAALATPAAAQDLTPAACEAALQAVSDTYHAMPMSLDEARLSGGPALVRDGWCVFSDASFDPGQGQRPVTAGALRLAGDGVLWMAGLSPVPSTLEVRIDGLNLPLRRGALPQIGGATSGAGGTLLANAGFGLDWSPEAKVMTLRQGRLAFANGDTVDAEAQLAHVDLTTPSAAQGSLLGFALTDLHLRAEGSGMFRSILYPALAHGAPAGGEAGAGDARKRMQAEAGPVIHALPGEAFRAGSREALTNLVAALHDASGTLTLDLRARDGIGPARILPLALHRGPVGPADLAALFDGSTVDVGWTR